jgi:hypothetical protein
MGDVLGNFARFLQIVHCVIHHRDKITNEDVLDGLKCGLRAFLFALKTILVAVLQIVLCPLYLLLTFLFFES